jgi:hypothetical protein
MAAQLFKNGQLGRESAYTRQIAKRGITGRRRISTNVFMSALPVGD